MQIINSAYATLSNPTLRRQYDEFLTAQRTKQSAAESTPRAREAPPSRPSPTQPLPKRSSHLQHATRGFASTALAGIGWCVKWLFSGYRIVFCLTCLLLLGFFQLFKSTSPSLPYSSIPPSYLPVSSTPKPPPVPYIPIRETRTLGTPLPSILTPPPKYTAASPESTGAKASTTSKKSSAPVSGQDSEKAFVEEARASSRKAKALYPQFRDRQSPLSLKWDEVAARLQAQSDPLLEKPNASFVIAQIAAAELGIEPVAQAPLSTTIPPTRGRTSSAFERPPTAPNGSKWPAFADYVPDYLRLAEGGRSTVTVDNTKNSSDVFLKLVVFDPQFTKAFPVRVCFIPAFSKFKFQGVAAGRYDVRYQDLSSGRYSKTEKFTLTETRSSRGTTYSDLSLTLYKVIDGNMETESIDESEF